MGIALIIKAIFVFGVCFGDTAVASSADLCHQNGVGDGLAPYGAIKTLPRDRLTLPDGDRLAHLVRRIYHQLPAHPAACCPGIGFARQFQRQIDRADQSKIYNFGLPIRHITEITNA